MADLPPPRDPVTPRSVGTRTPDQGDGAGPSRAPAPQRGVERVAARRPRRDRGAGAAEGGVAVPRVRAQRAQRGRVGRGHRGPARARTGCGRSSPSRSFPWAGARPARPRSPTRRSCPALRPHWRSGCLARGGLADAGLGACRSLGGMDSRPIGMFDSGFGGLTVARALIDLAPHEEFVYVGDTGRYPYGPA